MSPKAATHARIDIEDEEARTANPVIFFDDVGGEDVGIDDGAVIDEFDRHGPSVDRREVVSDDSTDAGVGSRTQMAANGLWHRVWRRRGTVLTGLVAVVLAVLLTLALVAKGDSDAVNGARVSGLAAARSDAVALAGYNYQHLTRDFDSVLARSTATFRHNFLQASDALKGTLTKFHATAVGHVVSAGVVSASASRVVALVFLTQKIENSTQSSATTDRSQVEITLLNAHGRWLINQVTLL